MAWKRSSVRSRPGPPSSQSADAAKEFGLGLRHDLLAHLLLRFLRGFLTFVSPTIQHGTMMVDLGLFYCGFPASSELEVSAS